MLINSLNKELQFNMSDFDIWKLSKERKSWRTMITNVLEGQGI